jgi:putative transposase
LLVNYPPKVSVSSLVNSLKGVSSYVLRRQWPRIAKCYWKNVLWSRSYFASSCGEAPLELIKRYIDEQATPLAALYPRPERRGFTAPSVKNNTCFRMTHGPAVLV